MPSSLERYLDSPVPRSETSEQTAWRLVAALESRRVTEVEDEVARAVETDQVPAGVARDLRDAAVEVVLTKIESLRQGDNSFDGLPTGVELAATVRTAAVSYASVPREPLEALPSPPAEQRVERAQVLVALLMARQLVVRTPGGQRQWEFLVRRLSHSERISDIATEQRISTSAVRRLVDKGLKKAQGARRSQSLDVRPYLPPRAGLYGVRADIAYDPALAAPDPENPVSHTQLWRLRIDRREGGDPRWTPKDTVERLIRNLIRATSNRNDRSLGPRLDIEIERGAQLTSVPPGWTWSYELPVRFAMQTVEEIQLHRSVQAVVNSSDKIGARGSAATFWDPDVRITQRYAGAVRLGPASATWSVSLLTPTRPDELATALQNTRGIRWVAITRVPGWEDRPVLDRVPGRPQMPREGRAVAGVVRDALAGLHRAGPASRLLGVAQFAPPEVVTPKPVHGSATPGRSAAVGPTR